MIVMLFNVLFLMLLGVAWRQMASAIRMSTVCTERHQRDAGTLRALARALYLLETGRPPVDGANQYKCYVSFAPDKFFKLKFTLTPGTPDTADSWHIDVAATTTAPTDSGPLVVDSLPP
jgi:hypothetical protein